MLNLVSGANKARRIEWYETCRCKCRFEQSVYNNKQCWDDDKCRWECKELIDGGVCDKGFIWNPSNCECEYYKSSDFSKYLEYKICKYREWLVDQLPEECTEKIEETKLVKINLTECRHNSCTLYIVLFSIIFTINVEIGSYFVYSRWYLKKDVIRVNNLMNL